MRIGCGRFGELGDEIGEARVFGRRGTWGVGIGDWEHRKGGE